LVLGLNSLDLLLILLNFEILAMSIRVLDFVKLMLEALSQSANETLASNLNLSVL